MSLGLMEAAVGALRTYLEVNIAAKLDELDAEYGDFALDDIAAWYEGNFPKEAPSNPGVVLHAEAWETEEQTAAVLYGKNHINLVIFVGDADAQRRFKKLCRYARACIELLQEGEDSYGYIHWLEGRLEVSDTLAAPSFMQAVVLPISLYPASGESY